LSKDNFPYAIFFFQKILITNLASPSRRGRFQGNGFGESVEDQDLLKSFWDKRLWATGDRKRFHFVVFHL